MSAIEIKAPSGILRLRPERAEDRDFRLSLFCQSRLPEWDLLPLASDARAPLMRQQFEAQTVGYATQFPNARFDIIEAGEERIGRIVVDRPGDRVHLVDIALLPLWRGRGLGSAILRALIEEARAAQLPVRLEVATGNDPSAHLYLRLGFVRIAETPMHIEMEWRASVPPEPR